MEQLARLNVDARQVVLSSGERLILASKKRGRFA
jgi:hypothetical protein